MKAWHLFLFVYVFQVLLGIVASYYIPSYSYNPYLVNVSQLENNDADVTTSENQYLATAMYYGKQSRSYWDILLHGLTPLGEYIETLFPDVLPKAFIFLLNTIWGIIFTLTGLEFMRGFRIFGD